VTDTPQKVEELLDRLQFSTALTEIWKAISRTNKYIDETMPWHWQKVKKTRQDLPLFYTILRKVSE